MYDEQRSAQRLTQLRMQKNVSARDMSLSIGQSEGYINKIENGRSLPSMMCFFFICEYFGITPEQFFNYSIEDPMQTDELIAEIGRLSPQQSKHLLEVVKDITRAAPHNHRLTPLHVICLHKFRHITQILLDVA